MTNLTEKDIQTVVPKNGGIVMIVKGNHKGQKATLIDRKKSKGRGFLFLVVNFLAIISTEYDGLISTVCFW